MTRTPKRDMAELGRRLDARQAELSREVRTLDDEAGDVPAQAALNTTGTPHDPADEGDRGEQAIRSTVRHAEKERDQRELQQIADAQQRMHTGDYGRCVDCGVSIALARLQALPAAERCIACQERYERSHPAGVQIELGR